MTLFELAQRLREMAEASETSPERKAYRTCAERVEQWARQKAAECQEIKQQLGRFDFIKWLGVPDTEAK